jgi:hypothetical protein
MSASVSSRMIRPRGMFLCCASLLAPGGERLHPAEHLRIAARLPDALPGGPGSLR